MSFESRILPLRPRLLNTALWLASGNEAEAEDLVQDTLLAAWKSWETFKHEANVEPWCHTILLNRFRSNCRRFNTAAKHRPEQEEMADRIEAWVRYRDLQTGLAALDADHLEVVAGTLEGLEPKEMALREGIPASTVRTRLLRAKQKLRKAVA